MQYTTQQLQGGPKYSHKTRIGNWNEDLELNTVQNNNYQSKKNEGTLPFAKTIAKYQQSYRQVPWSFASDGNLNWGHMVMMQNAKTQGYVVMDIGDRVNGVEEGYSISSTGEGQNPGPMTRSVFQLCKEASDDLFTSDGCVRYGQKLRIEANPHLFRKRLQLASAQYTSSLCAPLSGCQVAYMNASKPDANGVWVIDHVDPTIRFEMQGEPVKAGDPVLLRHVTTCVYLGADNAYKIKNDFGSENEVHCKNHSSHNKSQNLALEQDGRLTVDVSTKFQRPENIFYLQTAPDNTYGRPIEELSKFEITDCIKELRAKIFDRCQFGLKALTRIFQAMDKKGNCRLDVDDFRWGLLDFGIEISKEEACEMSPHFGGENCIHWGDFLKAIRQPVSDAKAAAIKKVYGDLTKGGSLTLDAVASVFDATKVPAVAAGKRDERECYMSYMSCFDGQARDYVVSENEFLQLHMDAACSSMSDDDFASSLAAMHGCG